MQDSGTNINIIELLMGIKEAVSSIKTEMASFKEAQKVEKENTMREIDDVRTDYKRDLSDLEARLIGKINNMQTVQNNLVGDVDTLKHAEERKDAKRWRTVMAFIGTALGGMLVAKLPDIIKTLIILSTVK